MCTPVWGTCQWWNTKLKRPRSSFVVATMEVFEPVISGVYFKANLTTAFQFQHQLQLHEHDFSATKVDNIAELGLHFVDGGSGRSGLGGLECGNPNFSCFGTAPCQNPMFAGLLEVSLQRVSCRLLSIGLSSLLPFLSFAFVGFLLSLWVRVLSPCSFLATLVVPLVSLFHDLALLVCLLLVCFLWVFVFVLTDKRHWVYRLQEILVANLPLVFESS